MFWTQFTYRQTVWASQSSFSWTSFCCYLLGLTCDLSHHQFYTGGRRSRCGGPAGCHGLPYYRRRTGHIRLPRWRQTRYFSFQMRDSELDVRRRRVSACCWRFGYWHLSLALSSSLILQRARSTDGQLFWIPSGHYLFPIPCWTRKWFGGFYQCQFRFLSRSPNCFKSDQILTTSD